MDSTTSERKALQTQWPIDVLCGRCEQLLSSECVHVQPLWISNHCYYFALRETLTDGQDVDVLILDQLWPTSRILKRCYFNELYDDTLRLWVHGSEEEVRSRISGCHLCSQVIGCLDRATLENPQGTPGSTGCTRYAVPYFRGPHQKNNIKIATLVVLWLAVGGQELGRTDTSTCLRLTSPPSTGQDELVHGNRSMGALSQTTLHKLRLWLQECKSGHLNCTSSTSLKQLPTRLLHIGKSNDQFVLKLIETRSLRMQDREALKYSALSHCWGPMGLSLRLVRNKYADFLSSISFSSLPQTFRDAVIMTNALGLECLWVDALCIIQDDDPDWYKEAPLMRLVYSQAEVTLAATAASDGADGLFLQDYMLTPCRVIPRFPNIQSFRGSFHVCDDKYTAHQLYIDAAPLNQRGWVLQERILSPRTIHFTQSQLFWECLATEQNERGLDFLNAETRGAPRFLSIQTPWTEIVSTYSRMKLTVPKDKLVAIGGVAEAYGTGHGFSPDDYLAGIWRAEPAQLLWAASQPSDTTDQTGPGESTVAPSWSWAACPGTVSYPSFVSRPLGQERFEFQQNFRIRDSSIQLLGSSRFGAIQDGILRVETDIWLLTKFSETRFYLQGSGGACYSVTPEDRKWIDLSSNGDIRRDPSTTSSYFLPLGTLLRKNEPEELFGLQIKPCGRRKRAFLRVKRWHFDFHDCRELHKLFAQAGSIDLDDSLYVERLEDGAYVIDLA